VPMPLKPAYTACTCCSRVRKLIQLISGQYAAELCVISGVSAADAVFNGAVPDLLQHSINTVPRSQTCAFTAQRKNMSQSVHRSQKQLAAKLCTSHPHLLNATCCTGAAGTPAGP
jgi:hypothetical protein